MKKIIVPTGYMGSGSSAITDLISEFRDCQNEFKTYEYVLLHCPNGLFDLEDKLLIGNNAIRSDEAIRSFENQMQKLYNKKFWWVGNYQKIISSNFMKITEEYINNIQEFNFPGYWYTHEEVNTKMFFKLLVRKPLKILTRNKVRFNKILKYSDGMRISYVDSKKFYEESHKYIYKIIEEISKGKENIILDQFLLPFNLFRVDNYFDDKLRVIVVARDPRDVFIINKYIWQQKQICVPFPLEVNDILFNKNTSSLCAPFLNELRKKSISGDKMFSEAPYTEAALMCLLGGIDTMDNGGYMERFKDKTCVLEVFRNNGYKVFYNNYYPSIYPSYMAPSYDERKYIEGFQFSHIWDYRLKYYSEIFEKNEINNKEYKILADMLDDNFKNWIIYLEKIRDKDSETSMLNGNIDVSDIDNDIKQIKVEYEKFSKDNKKYLNSLFEQKENHQLFNIKTYMMSDKVHDNIVRNKVIEKYKTTFDRINKINLENNLLNNKLPIKNIIKSIINKDFKTAKGLLAGYKNSLFDKDLYDRISNNYDQFKVQRSFYTVSQELFTWIKENKDKKWMSYVHIDDAHFPENFFTYDTKDLKLIEEDFKRINTYLNNIPKGYKGSISYDLSLMYCDNIIKNIFKFLEKEKILNDTSIVITADHGFSYYFSPVREKYVISSYRENYNVPFIIWSKDIKNKMINNYCSTKDIPATLLDLVDIKIPKVFKGQSLLESKGQDYALLEYMGGGCPDIYRRPIILGVRTDNYDVVMEVYINKKFIDNEIKEVYNIRKDPFEYDNLFKQENIKEKIKKELQILENRYNEIISQYEVK